MMRHAARFWRDVPNRTFIAPQWMRDSWLSFQCPIVRPSPSARPGTRRFDRRKLLRFALSAGFLPDRIRIIEILDAFAQKKDVLMRFHASVLYGFRYRRSLRINDVLPKYPAIRLQGE